jgi:hypothetical protein
MENQAVKEFRSIAIKWGIISGLVSILYAILLYVIDATLLAGAWTSLSLVFIIVFIVLSVKEFKLTQEGYINLSEALFTAFFTYVISALISDVCFYYVLMNFIDPNLPIIIKDTAVNNTLAMMQKFGSSEADISKVLETLNEQDYSVTLKRVGLKFLSTSAFGFVLSFIIAAIMKKKRPVFE